MTIDLDPESQARRQLGQLPFSVRLADVCHCCGQHTLSVPARIAWLASEGFPPAWCERCRVSKTLDRTEAPEPAYAIQVPRRPDDLATKWLDEVAQ